MTASSKGLAQALECLQEDLALLRLEVASIRVHMKVQDQWQTTMDMILKHMQETN